MWAGVCSEPFLKSIAGSFGMKLQEAEAVVRKAIVDYECHEIGCLLNSGTKLIFEYFPQSAITDVLKGLPNPDGYRVSTGIANGKTYLKFYKTERAHEIVDSHSNYIVEALETMQHGPTTPAVEVEVNQSDLFYRPLLVDLQEKGLVVTPFADKIIVTYPRSKSDHHDSERSEARPTTDRVFVLGDGGRGHHKQKTHSKKNR